MSECKLCSNPLNDEEIIKNLGCYGVCVCDGCASVVADAYESWHGGQERWGGEISKIRSLHKHKREG